MPKTDPPTTLTVQPLIKGDGAKVGAADTITFDYPGTPGTASCWRTRTARAGHRYQLAEAAARSAQGPGGQTVGSRVLLVVPPADGYPDGNASPKIEKDTTLVLVVDLLFAAPSQ